MLKPFKILDSIVEKSSSYLLVIAVLSMLGLSISTIVLRWFSVSFLWVEPLTRHLVFLSAFLGGVIATGRKNHIGIDVIGKYFEAKKNHQALGVIEKIISLSCFIALVWLIMACYQFTIVEAEYGKVAFLGIHSKYLVAIAPFGFSLIAYRFLYLFLSSFETRESK